MFHGRDMRELALRISPCLLIFIYAEDVRSSLAASAIQSLHCMIESKCFALCTCDRRSGYLAILHLNRAHVVHHVFEKRRSKTEMPSTMSHTRLHKRRELPQVSIADEAPADGAAAPPSPSASIGSAASALDVLGTVCDVDVLSWACRSRS